jgi:hypothetical protein
VEEVAVVVVDRNFVLEMRLCLGFCAKPFTVNESKSFTVYL